MIRYAVLVLLLFALSAAVSRIAFHATMLRGDGPFARMVTSCQWPIAGVLSSFLDGELSAEKDSDAFVRHVRRNDPRFPAEEVAARDDEAVRLHLLLPWGVDVGLPGVLLAITEATRDRAGDLRRCGFMFVDREVFVVKFPPDWVPGVSGVADKLDGEPHLWFLHCYDPAFTKRMDEESDSSEIWRHMYRGSLPPGFCR